MRRPDLTADDLLALEHAVRRGYVLKPHDPPPVVHAYAEMHEHHRKAVLLVISHKDLARVDAFTFWPLNRRAVRRVRRLGGVVGTLDDPRLSTASVELIPFSRAHDYVRRLREIVSECRPPAGKN